ncbi:TPA: DUF551 domain-containing protein [Klebsiella pneumoniae]|jgi:hypothetical protein|nr:MULTISPECIES: DUF551 domain-containing protein [Klebsiella]DAP69322.1 MAG TPA: Protein of unknown function (DUF551) [Caudoviricetes sp.]MDY1678129.1 DUF551 domain-containing protein [Klebsiella pneumoniae]MDY1700319.1 DUF551 domain-containing protein [Klebsiella pneumoniae]MDY1865608.1 DUF551 domain-containing protein [Klebsiella pneumoniae]MDY1992644.1 DUF551 domain-containing protein [Klebsiella pneumoniae]
MTKSAITRERLEKINSWRETYGAGSNVMLPAEEAEELARIALVAMDSEPVEMPLDYLQGHKDGLERASQLAEANHPDTGDWLYDDPIELAKAIRKGPDMPPAQPVAYSEPVGWTDEEELRDVNVAGIGYLFGIDREANKFADPRRQIMLYRHAQPAPVVPVGLEHLRAIVADPRLLPRRKEWIGGQQYSYVLLEEVEAIVDEACRAAPQSPGSEPVTVPGKWIPVSEQMPVEFEAVIAFDGDQVYGEAMYSSGDGFTIDGYDPCDRVQLQSVTHWMPLPAAPEEVKGE